MNFNDDRVSLAPFAHVFSPIIARSCGISHLRHHPLCHRIGSGREIPGVKIRHPVIMMHIDYKPTGCISFFNEKPLIVGLSGPCPGDVVAQFTTTVGG